MVIISDGRKRLLVLGTLLHCGELSAIFEDFWMLYYLLLAFLWGFFLQEIQNPKCIFSQNKLKQSTIFSFTFLCTQLREKIVFKSWTFYKSKENGFCSYIHNSTMLFNYTQMKLKYLSLAPPNMNSIWEVCDSLGTDSLTSFVGNHWATGWLWVNSISGEGRDYKL